MERKMSRFKHELPDIESRLILSIGKYVVRAVSGDVDYPYGQTGLRLCDCQCHMFFLAGNVEKFL